MPICKHCGAQSPAGADRCEKCGISFGHQVREIAGERRYRTSQVIRAGIWGLVLLVLLFVGPGIYHKVWASYLQVRLKTSTERVIGTCGGPITPQMDANRKQEIEKCASIDPEVMKAQTDYAAFTKNDK